MKRISVAIAVLGLMALMTSSAMAKVEANPTEASMVGPGLPDGGIDLDSGQARGVLEKTGAWDAIYGGMSFSSMSTFDGDLGPRYTLTYDLAIIDHRHPNKELTATFIQYVHPFATGGPVVVVPEGQKLPIEGMHEAGSGWANLSDFAMMHLRAYGLPRRADVLGPAVAAGGSSGPTQIPYPWILIAVTVLGAGIVANRRMWGSRHTPAS